MHQLNVNVAGDPRGDQPYLVCDNPPGGTRVDGEFAGAGGSPNRCTFVVPNDLSGGGSIYYDQGRQSFRVIIPNVDGSWEANDQMCWPPEYGDRLVDFDKVAMHYGPVGVYLEPLDRRDLFYWRGGHPHTVIETSDFRLYERFLRGDIDPVLEDRHNVGFNCVRVWLLNTSVGHIVPSEWGETFYKRIPEFLGRCGAAGLDVEFTVFTQTQSLMPRLEDQQAHYDRVVEAIGELFCFVEGVNESDMHDNAVDQRLNLHKPSGATFDLCRGSSGAGVKVALAPVMDSSRWHTNDTSEWWRKQAHNGMEIAIATGRPNIANENTRPDRDPNPYRFFDAAAGAALLSAGSCFHSNSGKDSAAYAGIDLQCAVQHVAGARSVPLDQRVFPYERHDELNGEAFLRVYRRGSHTVPIRK